MGKVVQTRHHGQCRTIRVLAGSMEWKLTAEETGGRYCVLETFVPPGTGVPPHQHADQEAFYIVEGTLEVAQLGSAGLEWHPVAQGDFINVPSDEIHGFRNTSATQARLLVTATAGLATFFEEAGIPLPSGTPSSAEAPSAEEIERVLAISRKHGIRFIR
jgi:quercetin dioxygenase-like cupin family protein